jgi:hypothetical protein
VPEAFYAEGLRAAGGSWRIDEKQQHARGLRGSIRPWHAPRSLGAHLRALRGHGRGTPLPSSSQVHPVADQR